MQEIKKANPTPLGLIGFGMTTILLNLHNVGLFELNVMVIAMGIALGGIAQILAGILEYHNNNTFGETAFIAYGLFWLSLVFIWLNPFYEIVDANSLSMGFYLIVWGVFTGFMFIAALKHNMITKIVFGSLTLLFFLLAIGDFANSQVVTYIAGAVGIFCGISALYSAVGQIVNAEYGKKVFPL